MLVFQTYLQTYLRYVFLYSIDGLDVLLVFKNCIGHKMLFVIHRGYEGSVDIKFNFVCFNEDNIFN